MEALAVTHLEEKTNKQTLNYKQYWSVMSHPDRFSYFESVDGARRLRDFTA